MSDLIPRLQAALGTAYRIERELGGAGMSRVFLAAEVALRRQVAVKVLPPELASEVSEARFRHEIEVAARLQHTNILPVLTAGASDRLLYYVMPFVTGESLRQRVTREGRLRLEDGVGILAEIADALAYAHAEGVIHRDVKPENVLLLGRHAVLTDFGVARALAEARSGARLTETGMSVGTPGYMSPEQAAGERQLDARADIYALGVMGYEMLAGAPPFAGPTAQALLAAHLAQTPRPLRDIRPDVPEVVGDIIMRALEKDLEKRLQTAGEFRNALTVPTTAPNKPIARRRLALLAVLALSAAGAGFMFRFRHKSGGLDPNLVAVAPFDVLDPRLALWREGLVDVLSRNLDGAGPLRTVSPTLIVKRWEGRADRASAAQLGLQTNAGLVVIGSLVGVGGDSVKLSAFLLAANTGPALGDVELRGISSNLGQLADSLAVALLRELGRSRPIAAVPLASIGSRSLPALRAFLQGEQLYRRSVWDSAIAFYQRAITVDSGFALALSHLGRALTWTRSFFADSLALSYSLRAGAYNHGLTVRDSLLIAADSLAAVLYRAPPDSLWWPRARRAHATLEEAARRYPEDPDVWYNLGELRDHLPLPGFRRSAQLEPFERAIAIDSAFAPAYDHAVGLRLEMGDSATARRLLGAYAALGATGSFADGLRLAGNLLDRTQATSPSVQRTLDTAAAELLNLDNYFRYWPDSAETSVMLNRLLAAGRRATSPLLRDPAERQLSLVRALAFRGHVREAFDLAAGGPRGLRAVAEFIPIWGMLGALPRDTVSAVLASWSTDVELGPSTLIWWAVQGDTASIHRVRAAQTIHGRTAQGGWRKARTHYGEEAAAAYFALAGRDTVEAIRRLVALADSMCVRCNTAPQHFLLALLHSAQRRDREAAAVLDSDFHWSIEPLAVLWRLERARVSERLGDHDRATREYRFVADAWRNADAELQPYAQEAANALRRLRGPRP